MKTLNSALSKPVAYTDADELRFPHATSDMWPVPLGFGKDVPLYSQEYVSALIDENSAAKIAGVKEFAAEMLARADDTQNSLPDDVRAGMRTAAAFAKMFIDLNEVSRG